MNINQADIFDFAAWIGLAPDYDWNNLASGGGGKPFDPANFVTPYRLQFDATAETITALEDPQFSYTVDGEQAVEPQTFDISGRSDPAIVVAEVEDTSLSHFGGRRWAITYDSNAVSPPSPLAPSPYDWGTESGTFDIQLPVDSPEAEGFIFTVNGVEQTTPTYAASPGETVDIDITAQDPETVIFGLVGHRYEFPVL